MFEDIIHKQPQRPPLGPVPDWIVWLKEHCDTCFFATVGDCDTSAEEIKRCLKISSYIKTNKNV